MKIAICAAFPQELKYIIRNFSAARSPEKRPFPVFLASRSSHELVIVQTGMGAHNAQAALNFTLTAFSPETVFFIGFGGALYPAAAAGDLVWAQSVVDVSGGTVTALEIPDPAGTAEKLSGELDVRRGTVVTLPRRMEKKEVAGVLPPEIPYPVCDMETYHAAKLAEERGVQFFAVRSITDTAEEEIPPELFDVTDESGKYELSRAMGMILGRPHLIPAAITLGRNSAIAAKNLYECMKLLIEML